ncbi:MAG: LrgB family protein [Lachnospiraceae bacterium]|nr:LrgB family protein [Lachnospiraceae bacterium]
MNGFFLESATLGVVVSLAGYMIGMAVKRRWKLPVFNPLLIAIILVIGFLLLFRVDYEAYNSSAKYLSYLLTPATVSLAIPLYQKLELLKKNGLAILVSVFSGAVASMGSILAMALLFGLSHEGYVTLLPKSITTAIGIGVAEELGGYPTITAAVIIITGVFGNMVAETLCKVFKISHPVARGLAIGSAAHAIGTTKAMEMGETEGAMSSLAIVVSGVITVLGAVVFAGFY